MTAAKEALFYKKQENSIVQCTLCPHFCTIKDGNRGKCAVRENKDGKLYSLVYQKLVSAAVDPIEKKPMFHFLPGSKIYSIATQGCNFRCEFCQNCEISQAGKIIYGEDISPKQIVDSAISAGCKSIAYTYTEPTIFYEYAFDTAKLAKKQGLKNVFVTNGFINPKPLKKISPYLDAANIDLKSFSDDFYRKVIGGRLEPVLSSIKLYHELGIFIEITTLIIPGKNDDENELQKIAEFIASIDNKIPWHVSGFHPDYKMLDSPQTSEKSLEKAVKIGKKAGLNFIYAGNIPGNNHESTFCPNCGKKIIDRIGFSVNKLNLSEKNCIYCGEKINIVMR